MKSINLLKYRKIIYSQYGEEGVLEFLIKKLNLNYIECCEFGMSDTTYSNTFYFIENYNSFGLYIDKSYENIKNLKLPNTIVLEKEIKLKGENTLDVILSQTPISKNFDILSIDIDNNDYHVWDSLKNYNPKIVIIEFNPFISPKLEYVFNGSRFSSSFLSTVKLGESKGYSLVCMTGNLIFVKTELLKKTELEHFITNNPENLFLNDAIPNPENKRSFTFLRYLNLNKSLI